MDDDALCLNRLTNMELLTYFASTYPQDKSWGVLWTPTNKFLSAVTTALHRRMLPRSCFFTSHRRH